MKPSCATTKLTPSDGAAAWSNTSREPAILVASSPRAPASPRQKRRAPSRKRSFHSAKRGAEPAELVSARADIPRLGDQARLGQDRIGAESLEERRIRVKAIGAAAERGREIEPEAVEAAMDHPAPQRPDRHVDDERAVERQAIAGAGVVDVGRRIAGIEAKEGGVVEAAERQRRPELVAFAVVVEDDVEDRLHAGGVQSVGRRAHLRPAARAQVADRAPRTRRCCSPRRSRGRAAADGVRRRIRPPA